MLYYGTEDKGGSDDNYEENYPGADTEGFCIDINRIGRGLFTDKEL